MAVIPCGFAHDADGQSRTSLGRSCFQIASMDRSSWPSRGCGQIALALILASIQHHAGEKASNLPRSTTRPVDESRARSRPEIDVNVLFLELAPNTGDKAVGLLQRHGSRGAENAGGPWDRNVVFFIPRSREQGGVPESENVIRDHLNTRHRG